jgi:hypothetical protein
VSSACTRIACWLSGSRPHFCAETATPARVWVWRTQLISGRAWCTQPWITNPAWLMPIPVGSSRTFASMPIFTRFDAVISSNISPYGLMRMVSVPATRAEK